MSRVSVLEQLMSKNCKTALEFNYDTLPAPTINMMFSPADIKELERIATSVRYSANIKKKYELIDNIMKSRGFVRAHAGTNRLMYHCLNDRSIGVKVAVDSVGMRDSPREYINQQYFKPFCCKIFEVAPSGVLAVIERVNPISSIEEFRSVAGDIFDLMVTKIIGKYVVDDLGTNSYMNFGLRQNSYGVAFGPVIIDFPYVYELDGAKLFCCADIINPMGKKVKCNGEIDYRPGFNGLYCTKCGKEYKAMDLAKDNKCVRFYFDDTNDQILSDIIHCFRARVIDNNKVIYDSGHKSKKYISKGEFDLMNSYIEDIDGVREYDVDTTVYRKYKPMKELRQKYYSDLQIQYYNELVKKNPKLLEITSDSDPMMIDVSETVKRNKNNYTDYNNIFTAPASMMDEDELPYREEVDADYIIDGGGNDYVMDINNNNINSDILTKLERETFPELYTPKVNTNSVEVVENVETEDLENNIEGKVVVENNNNLKPSDLFIDNNLDTNKPVQVASLEETKTEQIISDDKVQEYAEYIAHKDDEEEALDESKYIIDSEQDKNNPNQSPMSRPYAIKPNEKVSVYNKPVPNLDFMLKDKNKAAPNLIDNPFMANVIEAEVIRTRKQPKHNKDKGGYE